MRALSTSRETNWSRDDAAAFSSFASRTRWARASSTSADRLRLVIILAQAGQGLGLEGHRGPLLRLHAMSLY